MAKIAEVIYTNKKILKMYHSEFIAEKGELVHIKRRNKLMVNSNSTLQKRLNGDWRFVENSLAKSQQGLESNSTDMKYWFSVWEKCEPEEWKATIKGKRFKKEEKKVLIELVLKNYGSRYVSKLRIS